MENSSPLNICNSKSYRFFNMINRSHSLIHFIAVALLVYYRASFLFQEPETRATPLVPWFILFSSELLLCFMWLLGQAARWNPVSRRVLPENLPGDDMLPPIDVFIFTADPEKEPTVDVMNTVLSAMALDYPTDKLHVYLSDDGGAAVTLHGMREAWRFGRSWLPFCRKYGIKTRCPKAYFSDAEAEDNQDWSSQDFLAQRKKIKEEYEKFKDRITTFSGNEWLEASSSSRRDHPPFIEVIEESSNESLEEDQIQMPLLVYVSREKRPSHPHHFKAGACNVLVLCPFSLFSLSIHSFAAQCILTRKSFEIIDTPSTYCVDRSLLETYTDLRISGVMSNSPYILVLDCDMYCNDPTSARQAMCFHLDPKISASLALVQLPQKFHNLSENDIYDSEIRIIFKLAWPALDGLRGPILSGTNFYIKRKSLYGNSIKRVVAERSKVGFMYQSVVEDFLTGFTLHCKGWRSVYLDPSRPQFLGSSTTNLNDLLTQGTRWASGLVEVGISRFCPLLYGTKRMSTLQSMCYAEFALSPLLYCLSLLSLATVPQLCMLNGIPLYPKVANQFFYIFPFIFVSSLSKHLFEVLITGGTVRIMINEQRIWMIKSATSYVYGSLDAVMKKLGMREASFVATNKVEDSEQVKRYEMGIFDFQASPMFLAPMVTILLLNMAAFVVGITRIIFGGNWEDMLVQVLLTFYILVMNYPVIEGMTIRKDKGRIQPAITLLSATFAITMLCLGSVILMY
ncbi:hypothetical protein Tsubulata_048123 [Turnera subulata]|uniref:Cellulose synthase-like protein G2 n=1 Tax=Turnera subulata TaxID=218843 RepID=A0A9Q0FH65_9ROSI|nr:hypothetical protein Tsubulata_048123 [Turnera subulata]